MEHSMQVSDILLLLYKKSIYVFDKIFRFFNYTNNDKTSDET